MKLKYYLRGLGIGIVMTALIAGVATKGNQTITDAEIKERALQLGMVEQRTLADIKEEDKAEQFLEENNETMENTESIVESEESVFETKIQESEELPGSKTEGEESIKETSDSEEAFATEESFENEEIPSETLVTSEEQEEEFVENIEETKNDLDSPKEETQETVVENEVPDKVVEVQIVSGDSSYSISKRLEEEGLVDNAAEYDQYLCDNGYDRKLNVGIYKITIGMTEEEIAKIITRTR